MYVEDSIIVLHFFKSLFKEKENLFSSIRNPIGYGPSRKSILLDTDYKAGILMPFSRLTFQLLNLWNQSVNRLINSKIKWTNRYLLNPVRCSVLGFDVYNITGIIMPFNQSTFQSVTTIFSVVFLNIKSIWWPTDKSCFGCLVE